MATTSTRDGVCYPVTHVLPMDGFLCHVAYERGNMPRPAGRPMIRLFAEVWELGKEKDRMEKYIAH